MGSPRIDAVRRADPYFRAHIDAARLEDAEFLLSVGETIENVARRVGVTRSALEQTLARKGRG